MATLEQPKRDNSQADLTGDVTAMVLRHLPWHWAVFERDFRVCHQSMNAKVSFKDAPCGSLEDFFSAVELDVTSVDWRRRFASVMETGEPTRIERVAGTASGREPRVYDLSCSAIKDDAGRTLGGLVIVEDATDRAVLEKRLAFYERLAVVGKLAARIAHELNNPLDGILRFVNLAVRVKGEDDPALRYLQQARKGLLRMVRIIRELLEFSRSTITAFEHTSVNGMVEEAVRSLEMQSQQKGITITTELGEELPNVRSGDLFQVFCNLIKNAVDAMSQGDSLHIATKVTGNNIRVSFQDTGSGISPSIMDRIFEPFFTTKESSEGTGLGLAISKDIVEKYGGIIRASSEPGKGARFDVEIPVGDEL